MCTKTREAPSILSSRVIRTHRVNKMENFRLRERLQLIDQELLQIYCQHCTDIQDVRDNLTKIKEVKKGMEISVERRKLLLSQGFRIVPSTSERDTPLVIKSSDEDGTHGSPSESGFHDGRTLPWDEDPISGSTSGRQTPGFNRVTQYRKIVPPFHVGSRRNFIHTYTLAKTSIDKASTHVEESSDGNTSKRMTNKRPKTAASTASLLRVHSPSSSTKKGQSKRPQSTPIINIEETDSLFDGEKSEKVINTYNESDEEIFKEVKTLTSDNSFNDNNESDKFLHESERLYNEVEYVDGSFFKTKGVQNKHRNDITVNAQVSRHLSVEQSGTDEQYQQSMNYFNQKLNSAKNTYMDDQTFEEEHEDKISDKLNISQHGRPQTSTPLRERNFCYKEVENHHDNEAENHFLMLSEMTEVKTREQLMNQRPKSPRAEAWVNPSRPKLPTNVQSLEETFLTNMSVNRSRPSSARSNVSMSRPPSSAQGIRLPSRPGSAENFQRSRPGSAQSVRSRPGSARLTTVNFASKAESIVSETPSERGRKDAIKKRTHRPRVTQETVYDARPNKALSHGYSTMQMTIGNRQVKIYVPKFATDEIVGNARAKSAAKKAAFGHAKKV